jgi:hypothetical protein
MLPKIKRKKINWFGRILCRNCHINHVIEGRLEGRKEVSGRRGRICRHLLDALKENIRYWKLKEETLDRTLWRTVFGRDCGPVVRQTAKGMEYVQMKRC